MEQKILLWDIESTNLVADYGWVLCIAWKWLGDEKTNLIRIRRTREFQKDRTDDRGVMRQFEAVFEKADLHVFWFGEYFDLPFVQTRRLMADLKPLPPIPFVDGWRIARKKLKLRSNRLDAVSKIIPLPKGIKREEKLQPTPSDWRRAMAGHADALKVIEDRCVSDVLVLEQVYLAIRSFGSSLPNLSKTEGKLEEGCPSCGGDHITAQGYKLTLRGRKRQYKCQGCGHWFSLPVKVKV